MTTYVVWVAGKDAMEYYTERSTYEEAKAVADNQRRFTCGTIIVEKVVRENLYRC